MDSYDIYRDIAWALANCDGSNVEDFKDWAKLHPKYDEHQESILDFEKHRNHPKGLTLSFLKN